MTRYADPERCPDCLGPMTYGATRCPRCGLSLTGPLAARLFATLSEADRILQQLRTGPALAATPGAPPTAAASPQHAAPAGPLGMPVPGEPERARRRGLSAATVPQILLGLGAVCLLVAALVFLAVTWPVMGVAGRTATLVGFTLVAGALAVWLARRGLRAGAEALSLVALGLLAFDLFGARDSGWLGDIDLFPFLVLLGLVLLVVGSAAALAVRRTAVPALACAELVATLGLATSATAGVSTDWLPVSAALTLLVGLAAAVAMAAHAVRLVVLTVGATVVAGATWLALLGSSWERAVTHAGGRELWLELEIWPMLAAAALAAAPAAVTRLPRGARVAAVAVGETVLSAALVAAFVDEPATVVTTAGAAVVLVTTAVTRLTPAPWSTGTCVPLALYATWIGGAALVLGAESLGRLLDAGLGVAGLWSGSVSTVLAPRPTGSADLASWLFPVTVLGLALALIVLARTLSGVGWALAGALRPTVGAALVTVTTIGTVALFAVPLWLVLALTLLAAVAFTAWALHAASSLSLACAGALLALAVAVGLHAEGLTLTATLVGLALAGLVHLCWGAVAAAATGGALLAGFAAATVWTGGALADVDGTWTAAGGIVTLAVLVLGLPYVDGFDRTTGQGRPARSSGVGAAPGTVGDDETGAETGAAPLPLGLSRIGTELAGLVAVYALGTAGLEVSAPDRTATWAAVYLTLVGAAVSAMALLREDRRMAGWLGGVLLAAASWVRLWDIGVEAPEAYTLPSAVALAVVGLSTLRRRPGTSTMSALSPALALGLVPSLLWVFADPVALRSALLGLACLALVVGGVRARWTAPVLWGASVGLLVVLRHATPLTEAVPRWVLIGSAGALLIGMGITWERRLHEARALVGYMRALR